MSYTPLHLHTSRGSLLDSINTPESIVKRAKEIGLGAVAITDHGNCSNHLNFYKECKANDIKPLLGMEGYVTADMEVKDTTSTYYHIIMIAINQDGYKNLLKITSLGHVKGFYRKPRVDLQTIRKYGLGKGIIATSACFTKGTKVLTVDGYKNIEDITAGDMVMNMYGNWERVDYPTTRAYQGDGFAIKNTGDERNITCTANHKFWVADNNNKKPRWETAQQIFEANTKRYMLYPIKVDYNINKNMIHREEWHDSVIKTDSRLLKYQLPDVIKLTPELMRLFGMFIGDGSISITSKSKRISWTFSERDYPQFEPIVKAVERQLGIQFCVLTKSENCRVDMSTSSLDFVNFMYYLFGNCIANTKHIPLRLRHISMALDCELLFGYFMTDGYSRIRDKDGYSYGESVFCSVSEKLVDDVQKVFATMGMRFRRTSNPQYKDKWGVNHQKSYYLSLNGMYLASLSKSKFYSHEEVVSAFERQIEASQDRIIEHDGQKYLKIYIRDIKPIQLNTQVYCLHNQSHSFVVNNSIVHNCIGGEVPQMILKSVNKVEIHDKIQEYKDTFEEFYLEVQPTNIGINEEQKQINTTIQELSYETNTECVVTSDCHFTNKEDFELHNIFIQISIDRDNEVYKDCWLKSLDEIKDGLNYLEYQFVESCIENTNRIADKCNVELDIGHGQVPTAEIPDGLTLDKYFYNLIVQGCRDKGFQNFDKDKKKLYWDRIKHEYHVMVEKGFVHYFLLLYEIFQDASKENIIISPTARGSGASSLICYVLGITNVDPIKYNLIFERFLTMEKKGLPD